MPADESQTTTPILDDQPNIGTSEHNDENGDGIIDDGSQDDFPTIATRQIIDLLLGKPIPGPRFLTSSTTIYLLDATFPRGRPQLVWELLRISDLQVRNDPCSSP